MSAATVFHTSLNARKVEERLKQVQAKHAELSTDSYLYSDVRTSSALDNEILEELGFDFHSVSNFSITEARNAHPVLSRAVELMKEEFKDAEFIALFQNEIMI
jgi:hypothetical protein